MNTMTAEERLMLTRRTMELPEGWVLRAGDIVKILHLQFGKRALIAVMVEGGERGLVSVPSHLDCTFAWDQTGSQSEYSQGRCGSGAEERT